MTCLRSISCAMLAISTLVAAGPVPAEEQAPIKLTLHPAAEPTPALKYRLLTGFLEQIPGNAAVHYGKVTAEERVFFSNQELRESIVRWLDTPLEQLRRDKVHLPSGGKIEDDLRRAARCEYCDWQLPIRDEPFFTIHLSEVQQCREFGRILGARARLQMAEGHFDDTVETFQTGYALARNVAQGETIVNGLVGIAVASITNHQVQEFVQQPNSPNLYWAMTMLPTPMIDMSRAIEVESSGIELTFPELRELLSARRTDDEWRELFHRFATQVVEWIRTGEDKPQQPTPEELDEACEQISRTAKGILIQGGMSPREVQAMSVHQLALIHTLQLHQELLDDGIKCYSLPYPQAIAGIDAAIQQADEAHRDGRQIISLSSRILSAIRTARSASVRTDREIALLRMLEALRIYAASHDGKLPEQLSDITEVPIPVDPVTGEPFVYRREADKAFLTGPTLRDVPLNYGITMTRSRD